MATTQEARNIIYRRFITDWADRTPFVLDNETFDTQPLQTESWVRLVVRHSPSVQDSFGVVGNRRFLREGSIVAQVFTPTIQGLETSDQYTDALTTIFEGRRLAGDLWCLNTSIREEGTDGKWYMTLFDCIFNYEEVK